VRKQLLFLLTRHRISANFFTKLYFFFSSERSGSNRRGLLLFFFPFPFSFSLCGGGWLFCCCSLSQIIKDLSFSLPEVAMSLQNPLACIDIVSFPLFFFTLHFPVPGAPPFLILHRFVSPFLPFLQREWKPFSYRNTCIGPVFSFFLP